MSDQPMQWNGDARGLKFAIVAARFNGAITERLLEGARDALKRAGRIHLEWEAAPLL